MTTSARPHPRRHPAPAEAKAPPTRGRAWPAALLSAIVAALLFAPTLGFDFLWDDFRTQREALPALTGVGSLFLPPRDVSDLGKYYRPLSYGLYWMLSAGSGGPLPLHIAAVLLHATCAGLVAWLAFRLLRGDPDPLPGALAAGLVFATHPVHVESVAWVGAIGELLGSVWLLGALIAYDASRRSGRARVYLLALLFSLLALLTKETLVILPVFAAALELAPGGQRAGDLRAAALRLAGLALPALAYLVLRRIALGDWITGAAGAALEARSPSAIPAALLYYAGVLIAPIAPCHFVHELPAFGWSDAVLLAGVLAAAAPLVWRWQRHFLPAYGCVVAWLAMVPALAVAAYPLATTAVAERYAYVPSIGLALVAAGVVAAAGPHRRAALAALIGIAALFAWTTVGRLAPFANDRSFWTAAERCAPGHCLPGLNLADAAQARGDIATAEALYQQAAALTCSPSARGLTLSHLGVARYRRGDTAAAEESLRAAQQLAPWYSVPPYMLARIAVARAAAAAAAGDVQAERRQFEAAQAELAKALALRPDDPEYLYVAGQVNYFLGNHPEAVRQLSEALRLHPRHEAAPAAHALLAQLGSPVPAPPP